MAVTLSAALILIVLTLIGIKFANLTFGWALVAFLAGFLTASTGAAPAINSLLTAFAHAFNHH